MMMRKKVAQILWWNNVPTELIANFFIVALLGDTLSIIVTK